MIPYARPPVLHLGPLTIHAFGAVAAFAIVAGYGITLRRARALGLNERFAAVLYAVVSVTGLMAGFAAGRLLAPENSASFGISSAGVALGACLAAWVLLFKSPDGWRYLDALGFALPFTAAIARAGCFLAHDHVGARTENWLGVRFPGGTRFDLGLLHSLAAVAVTLVVLLLARRLTTPGLLFAIMATLIGVTRLAVMQAGPAGAPPDAFGLALTLGALALAGARIAARREAGPTSQMRAVAVHGRTPGR